MKFPFLDDLSQQYHLGTSLTISQHMAAHSAHTGQILVFDMENIPPTPSFQTTPSNSTDCYTFSTPLPTSQLASMNTLTIATPQKEEDCSAVFGCAGYSQQR